MRIGRIEIRVGYTVDLDNKDMCSHAIEAIWEDVEALVNKTPEDFNLILDYIEGGDAEDIPEFLIEDGDKDD